MEACVSTNLCVTENNDLAYSTSGNACLDFFTRIVRNAAVNDYIDSFTKAWAEDKNTAMQILLNLRDCRTGKGEKLIPVVLLVYLRNCLNMQCYEEICRTFVKYGYWKDLLRVMEISLRTNQITDKKADLGYLPVEISLFAEQLMADMKILETSTPEKKSAISLCAKWAPSENTHYDHHPMKFAKKIATCMGLNMQQYRKALSGLRTHLGILEMYMATHQYDKIDFSKLPAVAHRKSRNAFNRDTNAAGVETDGRRKLKISYAEYLKKLSTGEAKVNIKGTQPHELVEHYMGNGHPDLLIDGQWNALLQRIKQAGVFRDVTAVVDVSGSMHGQPMNVAIALGLLVAKCTEGPFHGQVITFHTQPSWFRIIGETLQQQVSEMRSAPWGGSTNMQAVFDLILNQAKSAKLQPHEMVKTLFIFTDMQFDQVNYGAPSIETTFEYAKRTYEEAGYKLPNIVCWNLRTSETKTMPTTIDKSGVVMLSGFSAELLKCILTGQDFTPMAMMRHVLEPYSVPSCVADCPNILSLPYPITQLQEGIAKSEIKKAFRKTNPGLST